MTPDEALTKIREAFESDRLETTLHFWDELRADAFVHADVECAVDGAFKARDMGLDAQGDHKFEVTGLSADGRVLSVVCSFKQTGAVLLITVYEGVQE